MSGLFEYSEYYYSALPCAAPAGGHRKTLVPPTASASGLRFFRLLGAPEDRLCRRDLRPSCARGDRGEGPGGHDGFAAWTLRSVLFLDQLFDGEAPAYADGEGSCAGGAGQTGPRCRGASAQPSTQPRSGGRHRRRKSGSEYGCRFGVSPTPRPSVKFGVNSGARRFRRDGLPGARTGQGGWSRVAANSHQ